MAIKEDTSAQRRIPRSFVPDWQTRAPPPVCFRSLVTRSRWGRTGKVGIPVHTFPTAWPLSLPPSPSRCPRESRIPLSLPNFEPFLIWAYLKVKLFSLF